MHRHQADRIEHEQEPEAAIPHLAQRLVNALHEPLGAGHTVRGTRAGLLDGSGRRRCPVSTASTLTSVRRRLEAVGGMDGLGHRRSKRTGRPSSVPARPHVRQPETAGHVACVRPCVPVPSCRSCSSRSASTLYTTGPLYRVRTWWSFDDPLADDPVIVGVYAAVGSLAGDRRARRRRPLATHPAAACRHRRRRGRLVPVVGDLVTRSRASRSASRCSSAGALIAGCGGGGSCCALRQLGWAIWCGVHVGLLWSFVALRTETPGTIDHRGEYAGIFFNRNSLALYAALGGLLGVLLGRGRAQRFARERELVAAAAVASRLRRGRHRPVAASAGQTRRHPRSPRRSPWPWRVVALLARRLVRRTTTPRRVVAGGGVARRSWSAARRRGSHAAHGSTLSGATPTSPVVGDVGGGARLGRTASRARLRLSRRLGRCDVRARRSSGLRATADVVAQRVHRGVARRRC